MQGGKQRVQRPHQQRGHGRHHARGHPHRVDLLGNGGLRPQAGKPDVDAGIRANKIDHGQRAGGHLANDGGDRRAGHPQRRQAQQPKNENRVQGDVHNGPHSLQDHGHHHIAHRLEQLFNVNVEQAAERQADHDTGVALAHGQHAGVLVEQP